MKRFVLQTFRAPREGQVPFDPPVGGYQIYSWRTGLSPVERGETGEFAHRHPDRPAELTMVILWERTLEGLVADEMEREQAKEPKEGAADVEW